MWLMETVQGSARRSILCREIRHSCLADGIYYKYAAHDEGCWVPRVPFFIRMAHDKRESTDTNGFFANYKKLKAA